MSVDTAVSLASQEQVVSGGHLEFLFKTKCLLLLHLNVIEAKILAF